LLQKRDFYQQCKWSLQQTAFASGQLKFIKYIWINYIFYLRDYHPHWPLDNWQHVFPSGHDDEPPGHGTSSTLSFCFDSVFKKNGIDNSPLLHLPAFVSQVYPFGLFSVKQFIN
jgi:hypothetical protein